MAKAVNKAPSTAQPETDAPHSAVEPEVNYTVDEFAKAADTVFGAGTSPDVVRAAFRKHGLTAATTAKARKIVEAFAKKEVK